MSHMRHDRTFSTRRKHDIRLRRVSLRTSAFLSKAFGRSRPVVDIRHPIFLGTPFGIPPVELALAASKLRHMVNQPIVEREQMRQFLDKGFPLIGVIFLTLGVLKLIQGDSWVVWFILGTVFGGLGMFSRRKGKQP